MTEPDPAPVMQLGPLGELSRSTALIMLYLIAVFTAVTAAAFGVVSGNVVFPSTPVAAAWVGGVGGIVAGTAFYAYREETYA